MDKWTVIGLYEDTGQVYTEVATASDAFQAMVNVAASIIDGADSLVILGAVQGEHELVPPGIDSGTATYTADLAALLREED